MRIWDIDPGFLNDKSLLGEHRELHGLFSIHVNGKKGYSRHPETVRWESALTGLFFRHQMLTAEMALRGFHHKSPLPRPDDDPAWPETFIDPPHEQFALLAQKYRDKKDGRIPLPQTPPALWASHKYSVLARDPSLYKRLGPLVAERGISFEDLSLTLVRALRTPPAEGRLLNGLEHMWGYVSEQSPKKRETLLPAALLKEIRTLAMKTPVPYLVRSTAIGELGVWTETGDPS